MNDKYEFFVASLMKPAETLDKEITQIEEILIEHAFEIASQADQLKYAIYDTIIGVYPFINRKYILSLKHMCMGFIGESSELIDPIKRITIYRNSINDIADKNAIQQKSIYENIVEEIGDLCFYLVGTELVINEIISVYKNEFQKDEIKEIESVILSINTFFERIKQFCEHFNVYTIEGNIYIGNNDDLTLEMCIDKNQEKLKKRYEKGSYSNSQATERKDKVI